ncbi:hypothetical protein EON67_04890 [archaeon]|nr:MAG: hypothetical protein EON67_04890 [archaeon]
MESGAAPEGLRVRSVVWARFRDGTERRAIVIDRAYQQPVPGLDASDPAAAGGWKYYVHYTDFNRRMDTWLSAPEVRPDVGASATAGAPAAHGKMVVEDVSHHHAGAGKSGGGSAHAGAGGEEIIDSDGTRLHIHKRNVRATTRQPPWLRAASRP